MNDETPRAPYSRPGLDLIHQGPRTLTQPPPEPGANISSSGPSNAGNIRAHTDTGARVGYPPTHVFDTSRTARPLFRDAVNDYGKSRASGLPVVNCLEPQIIRLRPLRRFKRHV